MSKKIGFFKNNLILAGGLIFITLSFLAQNYYSQSVGQPNNNQSSDSTEQKIKNIAENITVKIKKGSLWGSGVLIKQEEKKVGQKIENIYTVVTNAHVVFPQQNIYEIETFNKKKHQATLLKINFKDTDLALLQFSTTEIYQVVSSLKPAFSLAQLNHNTKVFVSGYPVEQSKGFIFISSQISLLLHKPMENGYQIGFSADIEQGMSGGGLLNDQGELIGIIGKGSEPPIGYPEAYIFADKSPPFAPENIMLNSSWAIPIESLAQYAAEFKPKLAWNIPSNIASQSSSQNTQTPNNTNQSSSSQNIPTKNNTNQSSSQNIQSTNNNVIVTTKPISTPDICQEINKEKEIGNEKFKASLTCNPQKYSLNFKINKSNQFSKEFNNFAKIDPQNIYDKKIDIEISNQDNSILFLVGLLKKNKCLIDTNIYIFSYDTKTKKYTDKNTVKVNSDYEIKSINQKQSLEIVSYDRRFACEFGQNENFPQIMAVTAPFKIYQNAPNDPKFPYKFVDVTKNQSNKKIHRDKLNKINTYYQKQKNQGQSLQSKKNEFKVLLANYLGNSYLLGEEKKGWEDVKKMYDSISSKDSQEYYKQLEISLKKNGYN